MDFCILFKKKIFLLIFWLEIWWDVVRFLREILINLFCKFGGGGCWLAEKWSAPQDTTKIHGFWTPHQNKYQPFWSSLQRQGVDKHFLCEKFVSNMFGLASVAYWMDVTRLCILREKCFPPWNAVTCGCDLPQNVCSCLTDLVMPSVTL